MNQFTTHTEEFALMKDIPYRYSIFGTWDGHINSQQQAKNILEIADLSREIGIKLSPDDLNIEKRAYFVAKNIRNK